jgi:hypothetical protein
VGDDIVFLVRRLHAELVRTGGSAWNDVADDIERLRQAERALADRLVRLLPHFHLSQRCRAPQGTAIEDWCSECAAIAAYEEARRG